MIGAPIPYYIQEAIIRYIMYKPGDLISVAFNNYSVILPRIDNTVERTIIIEVVIVDVGFDVLQPELLPGGFKARWGSIIEITTQKFF